MARMKRVREIGDAVERAMARAGVADLASRPVERLSKGQRQRVGMAQALLGSPRSYILDEPTIGLDPAQIVDTRRVIRGLAEGAAVLLSTHLLAEAAEVCDRVVVIVRGRVVAEERPRAAPDLEERFLRLVGSSELGGDEDGGPTQ
jgi:ABC-2 type transport system ATP-binding protein